MSATVLDGKALAARIRGELKLETERLAAENITPGLALEALFVQVRRAFGSAPAAVT